VDRLAAMEIFVCIVETGSFSAAARRLNVGQPAVSKTVASLEQRLGVKLVVRSTRGLTPTEAGEEYFQRAKRAIEDINEAEVAARGSANGLTGRLRLCAPVTFARLHILPHLEPFLARNPDLDVDVVLDDRQIDLIAEGIDVAVQLGHLSDSNATARKLDTCRLLILGTPAYFAKAGEPQIPEDLLTHQAVVYTQRGGGGAKWTFSRHGEIRTVNGQGRVRVSAAEGIRTLVLSGLGLAMASQWMFAPELASGEVIPVMNDWRLPAIDLWAVFPSGRMVSTKARIFAAYLAEVMQSKALSLSDPQYSTQE